MTAAAAVTVAGATALEDVAVDSAVQYADLKDLIRAVTPGFKTLENKTTSLHGAVDHFISLVETNLSKVDGLAVRVQAMASAQASTTSTLVQFREQVSGALAAVASGSSKGRVLSNSEASPADHAVADNDEDTWTRALVTSIRVQFEELYRSSRGGVGERGRRRSQGVGRRVGGVWGLVVRKARVGCVQRGEGEGGGGGAVGGARLVTLCRCCYVGLPVHVCTYSMVYVDRRCSSRR